MSNNVKISMDRVYRTRDGREVRIYAVDGSSDNPIHGAIKNDSEWIVCARSIDGRYSTKIDTAGDLIEVKSRHKRTVWVNAYASGHLLMWEDKRTADKMRDSGAIACIKVELDFEEGEGL